MKRYSARSNRPNVTRPKCILPVTSRADLLERLEARQLMSAAAYSSTYVYVESNNPAQGQNAILGYEENAATGALTPLPNGRFLTGGTGFRNAGPVLGPDDSDKEIIVTPDQHYLFAVNQGSNTVSEFAIKPDGSLQLQSDAPFSSGGTQPVSLSFSNDQLFVLNRGNSAEGTAGTIAPDLTAFFVGEDGQTFPVPNSTVNFPLNLSPAQVLTSADGKFTFVDDFATPSNLKVSLANTIEPFVDDGGGLLTAVKNGAAGLPANPPLVLGLVEDPVHHIIYSGQAPSGGVATFTYSDSTGKVSYVGSVASKGEATCWLNISPNGKYLYGTDSASDAISVYSLTNPLKPALIQEFYLNGPTVAPGASTAAGPTSEDFQFSFDPSGNYLYVLNHTVSDSFQQGNQLHTIEVGSNGKLSESGSPLFFSPAYVPGKAHVLGLAVATEANPAGYVQTILSQLFATTSFSTGNNAAIESLIDSLLQDIVTSAY
jgi:DNA-binding beta-propeller fold protein YncE